MVIYQKDYDDVLRQYLRDEATDGIYLTSDYIEPISTLDTIKPCDCTCSATEKLSSIHIVNKYNTNIKELMKKNLIKGEIFIDEDTQDVYIIDKGDLEAYWLRVGKDKEKLERNPWLDEDFDFS